MIGVQLEYHIRHTHQTAIPLATHTGSHGKYVELHNTVPPETPPFMRTTHNMDQNIICTKQICSICSWCTTKPSVIYNLRYSLLTQLISSQLKLGLCCIKLVEMMSRSLQLFLVSIVLLTCVYIGETQDDGESLE